MLFVHVFATGVCFTGSLSCACASYMSIVGSQEPDTLILSHTKLYLLLECVFPPIVPVLLEAGSPATSFNSEPGIILCLEV